MKRDTALEAGKQTIYPHYCVHLSGGNDPAMNVLYFLTLLYSTMNAGDTKAIDIFHIHYRLTLLPIELHNTTYAAITFPIYTDWQLHRQAKDRQHSHRSLGLGDTPSLSEFCFALSC